MQEREMESANEMTDREKIAKALLMLLEERDEMEKAANKNNVPTVMAKAALVPPEACQFIPVFLQKALGC